jgi:hypothetical protein
VEQPGLRAALADEAEAVLASLAAWRGGVGAPTSGPVLAAAVAPLAAAARWGGILQLYRGALGSGEGMAGPADSVLPRPLLRASLAAAAASAEAQTLAGATPDTSADAAGHTTEDAGVEAEWALQDGAAAAGTEAAAAVVREARSRGCAVEPADLSDALRLLVDAVSGVGRASSSPLGTLAAAALFWCCCRWL